MWMVYNLSAMSKVNHHAKQTFFSAPPRLSVENIGTAVLLLVSLVASFAYLRLGLARVFYPYALDLVELEHYLAKLLGIKVDIAIKKNLRKRIGQRILSEVQSV